MAIAKDFRHYKYNRISGADPKGVKVKGGSRGEPTLVLYL